MKHTLLFFFVLVSMHTRAQLGLPPAAGAQGAGMGGTAIGFRDIHAAFGNQAGLGWLDRTSAIAFTEQRFLGTALTQGGLGVAIPVQKIGTLGIIAQYMGTEGYREQKIGLSYARRIGDRFSIGAQFDYLGVQIPNYGSANLITFEVGLQSRLTNTLWASVHAYSPMPITFGDAERLPTIFRVGLTYTPNDQLLITTELEKDIDFPLGWKGGLSYRIVPPLWLRAGFRSGPVQSTLGLGFRLTKSLRLDIAAAYQVRLGFTPTAAIVFIPDDK